MIIISPASAQCDPVNWQQNYLTLPYHKPFDCLFKLHSKLTKIEELNLSLCH